MALRSVIAATIALAAALHAPCSGGEPGVAGSASEPATASPPPYVKRGDRVESRFQVFKQRMEAFHRLLSQRVKESGLQLAPKLAAVAPKPIPHGYQILPKLVEDSPPPPKPARAASAGYSWPRTDQLIDEALKTLARQETELERLSGLPPSERGPAYEKLIEDLRKLGDRQKLIDAHIQYNRLWQSNIARDKAAYDRQTALHDAVLERQAILDALEADDDDAFRQALAPIKEIDRMKERKALESDLKAREKSLAREIAKATGANAPGAFIRIEHSEPRLRVIHVSMHTDIEDTDFVRAFKEAVERVWRVREGEDEFKVELLIKRISTAGLYGESAPPQKGAQIDLSRHPFLFPKDGAALTTGAVTTHVRGRTIVLGPHDIAPRVLAHEFGHILGFKDIYFRGYKDLGEDGYLVMEAIADPNDIMGAPAFGPVLRRHFENIIERAAGKR